MAYVWSIVASIHYFQCYEVSRPDGCGGWPKQDSLLACELLNQYTCVRDAYDYVCSIGIWTESMICQFYAMIVIFNE